LLQATSDELIHLKEDPSSSCSGIRLDQVSPEGCRRYADRDLLLTWQTENRDGETDYTVRLWQLSSQTQLGDPLAHMDQVTGARLDSAGERVLTWGKDDTVRLWHHSTGKGLIPSMSHKNDVVGARFNADESRILSWGKDGTVRLWKASNGEPVIRSLVIPEGSPVKSAEFRAGEDCVVAQADNGKLWAWDLSFHSRGGADDTREMVEASTGTRLDAEGELKVMPRGEWLRTCKRLDLLHSAVCKLPVTH
jgi:WD40 repeat protein